MTLQPEIAKAFDELLAKARSATLVQFDERGLAWLCLVPDWPVPLADSCRFPSGAIGIGEFVDHTEAVGLTKTWETIGPGGEPVRWFGATDERRAELVQYLRGTWRQERLITEARTIADRLRTGTGPSARLAAPALRNWAVLVRAAASRGGTASCAEILWAQVRDFVDHDDTGSALDWIYAGETLGPLLGAPMTAAVARCRRYLERRYRRRIDDRYLRHLLPRGEQETEVARLLDGSDRDWALHIIGMGGVGKTMLIRSLTAGPFAQKRQIPVARIDFDHISPDYPLNRPGQLLVELSVELSGLFTDADQEARYERFLDDAERLHEISGGPAADPLAVLRTHEARSAISSFARLLRALPKPVLLVLDTCEELAKLHPAGSRIPAVDATFEILEQLHKEEGSFRVLFAGRRLLAPAGLNWRADDASRPPYLENLEPRPYLRLFEARGFEAGEVTTYLRKQRKLAVSDQLLDAMLAFSAELGRVPGVPRAEGDERPRYNPYDIDLLADWLEAEPDIDPADLTASSLDEYVAARIFGRLDPGLKPAAAAAALLGRFDERLLSLAGVPARDSAGRPTISKLLEQEWIDLEREDSSGSRFLQVRPALWPRLERYASSAGFAEHVAPIRPRLLHGLRAHVAEMPLRALSFEAVEAYLRLASQDEACAAWAIIERRVAETPADTAESAWSWARSVAERLIGERAGVAISPLLSAVSATLAAAVARTDPTADLRAQWTTVLAGAAAHPDFSTGARLEQRARLGLLTADVRDGVPGPASTHLGSLHDALWSGSGLVGGILASVEALLESRAPAGIEAEEFGRWLNTAEARLGGSPAMAWGRSLHGRLIAREGNVSSALSVLEDAQAAARSAVPAPDVALLNWSPPASVLHRIRAERLWLEWVTGRAVVAERIRREMADAVASPADDGWCLIALAALVLVDHGHAAAAAEAMADVSSVADWSPRCALHRSIPPLAAVYARVMLATGAGDNARVVLRAAITQLSADRASDARVTRLRVAELELIRALRDQHASSATGQAIYSGDPVLAAAGWLAAALTEPPQNVSLGGFANTYLSDDALLHARLRSSTRTMLHEDPALVAAVAERARTVGPPAGEDGSLPATAIDLCLDALELARLGLADPPAEPDAFRETLTASVAALANARQPGAEWEWARLWLRLNILSGDTVITLSGLVPVHRLGRLCLEEGELLALRLPALSQPLLEEAQTYSQQAGDLGMAVAAAVTSAVASVHAGDTVALDARLDRATRAWADLRSAAEPGGWPPPLDAWDGWASRLDALRYGLAALPGGPAELDLRPWEGPREDQPAAEVPRPPSAGPAPASGRRISRPVLVAGVSAGAGIAVAAMAALSGPVRLFFAWLSPSIHLGFWSSFGIAWGIVLLIAAAAIWGPRASRRGAQLLAAPFREDVVCTPSSEDAAVITIAIKLRFVVLWSAVSILAEVLTAATVSAVAVSLFLGPSGGVVWRALRNEVVTSELPLSPGRPSDFRVMRLSSLVDEPFRVTAALRTEALVDRPWEFLLAVSRTPAGVRRRCFRAVTVTTARSPGPWPMVTHTPVVSAQWQPFADDVWAPHGWLVISPASSIVPQPVGPARVVHVIGTPLLTSAGWCLRVAGARSSQVSESFESSQYSPSKAEPMQPLAPGLLAPDDSRLADGSIVVVQVNPSGSSIVSDPDQAGGLRQFGRQVVVAGGRPVIVVPSLPADVARDVMRSLARRVRRQRKAPSLNRVLDWVDGLRRAVLGGRVFGDPSWDKLAAAYDITVFWPVTDRKES